MKNLSFIRFKVTNLALIVVLGISFIFPSGINSVQARALQMDGVSIVNGTQRIKEKQASSQQEKTKKEFTQLVELLKASGMSDAVEDVSNLKKMDSHLLDLVSARLSGRDVTQAAKNNQLKIKDNQNVLVDIYISGALDQASAELEGLGMQVMATNESFGGVVEGYLPVDSFVHAVSLDSARAFLPVTAYGVDTGSVTSQGDASHNGPAARALGTTGAGVVVGVISDSMNQTGSGVNGSKASGDLPANVTVLADDPDGADEGRAMAEIIYDTAPGVTNMYFSSGTASGAAGKAASINNLVAHGVNIIADDIYYLSEPFFQDGMVSQAVDNAYNSGVAYFASAGNRARRSYESNFRNNGSFEHDFDPGAGSDNLQTITTVPNGSYVYIILQWDDPWGAAKHDFDFALYDTSNNNELAYSGSFNVNTGLPIEELFWFNNTGSPVLVADKIILFDGSNTAFLKYISTTVAPSEYNTASDAINPDAASAQGSLAVAAINWNESGLNDPESYSSRGPKTRLFNAAGTRLSSPEIRQKPQIAGADCVATSFGFGGGSFCGTSAATPSVAGVATLVLADRPMLSPSQLYSVLTNSASTIDCMTVGNPDTDCGYGFVLANNAINYVRTLPIVNVKVAGVTQGSYVVPPGSGMRPSYAGVNAGPVQIADVGSTNIIAAERVNYFVGGAVTSYAEMMGLPDGQLDTTYWFPWYKNDSQINTQLRIGNVSGATAHVHVYIAGAEMAGSPYTLTTSGDTQSTRLSYAANAGPVKIVSDQNIVAAERVNYFVGSTVTSYAEMMGLPDGQLDTTYWFPWYKNDSQINTQLRIANVSGATAHVHVYIAGAEMAGSPYTLTTSGDTQSTRLSYAANGGPVKIVSDQKIVASERVNYFVGSTVTSYAEMMGQPNLQLDTTYWFPWYKNDSQINTQLRIGNVSGATAHVHVYIGTSEMAGSPYTLATSGDTQSVRLSYAANDGPVKIVSDQNIVATERVNYFVGSTVESYAEMMGLPDFQLDTAYWFPWYKNDSQINTQLRFGVP